jgi:hypothetical protein
MQAGKEGDELGAHELGAELGSDEGDELGTDEGDELGTDEGESLGTDEGESLGTDEGESLGTDEGDELGTDEGDELGESEISSHSLPAETMKGPIWSVTTRGWEQEVWRKHSLFISPTPPVHPPIWKFVIASRVSPPEPLTVKDCPAEIFGKVPKILSFLSKATIVGLIG